MSYREGGYKSPFVGVGVIIGILVAISFAVRGLSIFGNMAGIGAPTAQSVEKMLFANAGTGEMYRVYKRTYPQDYDQMVADIVRHMKAGESASQLDAVIADDMVGSIKLHRADVIQAPANLFAAYRQSEIKLVEMVRNLDPRLCAAYSVEGKVELPPIPAYQPPQIALRIATLEAGAAGRDHPVNRTPTKPARADVLQLGRLMVANGASEANVSAFFNQQASGLPTLDQCVIGLSFYRAIDQLPGDKGNEFYAFLISRNS